MICYCCKKEVLYVQIITENERGLCEQCINTYVKCKDLLKK